MIASAGVTALPASAQSEGDTSSGAAMVDQGPVATDAAVVDPTQVPADATDTVNAPAGGVAPAAPAAPNPYEGLPTGC
jgi:hypothetical protein